MTANTGAFPGAKMLLVALLVSMGGSFHFGYQLVITNPSQDAFLSFLNQSYIAHYGTILTKGGLESIWSIIVALLFVGAIFGSLIINVVAEKAGRKRGLLISYAFALLSVVLAVISHFVNSFELYTVSRVTLGFSLGLNLGLSALYLTECSPKQYRGFISMMTGMMLQFGTVVGSIVAMPSLLGAQNLWWIVYAIEAVVLIGVLALMPFMHDSPGYLALTGRIEEARDSILFFHNCSEDEAELVLLEIKASVEENSKSMGMFGIFKDKHALRGTIVGSMVAFAMAFSGVAVINAFAVEILLSTGLTVMGASIANVGLTLAGLVSIVVSAFVVDRYGRRPLLLISNVAILILNLAIFAFMFSFEKYALPWLGYCLIGAVALFILFFSIGPGPLSFFITAELVGLNARSAGQSWASLVQMISRSILIAIYLPMKNSIGNPFSYLILFVAPMIFSVVFLYFMLPETKNKDHRQVLDEIENLPSMRSCCQQRMSQRSRQNSECLQLNQIVSTV
ncbi:hypothetical protein QR680_004008 [Steinernema hermaphroditum]|uniref:Major facilitator superfamily (MFS) profile domain-containing protein n=1 Tax=Steinernema hermaphroditum TaxID=289476 RepID=A0AA39LTB7_9BILA|nr:hypothetical protein QR680_004008 [Steinernema hermaphroditum]